MSTNQKELIENLPTSDVAILADYQIRKLITNLKEQFRREQYPLNRILSLDGPEPIGFKISNKSRNNLLIFEAEDLTDKTVFKAWIEPSGRTGTLVNTLTLEQLAQLNESIQS